MKKILLGDSIGKQAYDNFTYNDTIYSLACNQAISVAGHYFLLEEFIENYQYSLSDLEVVMIYRPSSFRNDLDQPFSFNYFLKPFYKEKYIKNYTEHLWKQIKEIPFYYLVNFSVIRNSRWSPGSKKQNNPNHFKISNISRDYLLKMQTLIQENGIKDFTVYCPFISDEYSKSDFNEFDNQIARMGLEVMFSEYYSKLLFIDESKFSDGVHLKDPKSLGENYLKL